MAHDSAIEPRVLRASGSATVGSEAESTSQGLSHGDSIFLAKFRVDKSTPYHFDAILSAATTGNAESTAEFVLRDTTQGISLFSISGEDALSAGGMLEEGIEYEVQVVANSFALGTSRGFSGEGNSAFDFALELGALPVVIVVYARARNATFDVLLLGSEALDTAQVDLGSLRFGPGGASPQKGSLRTLDWTRDGQMDLYARFGMAEAAVVPGPSRCLSGTASNGQVFEGCPATAPGSIVPTLRPRRH